MCKLTRLFVDSRRTRGTCGRSRPRPIPGRWMKQDSAAARDEAVSCNRVVYRAGECTSRGQELGLGALARGVGPHASATCSPFSRRSNRCWPSRAARQALRCKKGRRTGPVIWCSLRRSNGAGGGGRGALGILASGLSDGDEAQVQCADGLHVALPPGESRLVCWLVQEQEL